MILEQLIEKKDLMAYIDLKIKLLQSTSKSKILKADPENRELVKQKINGQIKELKILKKIIHGNKIKENSKKIYKTLKEMEVQIT